MEKIQLQTGARRRLAIYTFGTSESPITPDVKVQRSAAVTALAHHQRTFNTSSVIDIERLELLIDNLNSEDEIPYLDAVQLIFGDTAPNPMEAFRAWRNRIASACADTVGMKIAVSAVKGSERRNVWITLQANSNSETQNLSDDTLIEGNTSIPHETQETVTEWREAHYPDQDNASRLKDVFEELTELAASLNIVSLPELVSVVEKSWNKSDVGDHTQTEGELGDVQIATAWLASGLKMSTQETLDNKMAINRKKTPDQSQARFKRKEQIFKTPASEGP